MHMITLAMLNGGVNLFVVHNVSEPEVIHMLEYIPQNTNEVEVEPVGMVKGEDEEQGGGMVEGQCEEQGGGITESVVVLEERVEADDLVEGEIKTEVGGGECERGQCDGMTESVVVSEERLQDDDVVEGELQTEHSERQFEVAVNEGERGQCNGKTETDVVSEERVEADDVVEGEIETQVGVGEVEEDACDVRSWTSSGDDDGNDEVNYDCMEGLVDVNVECDLEEESDDDRGLSDDEWKSNELDSGAESEADDDEEEGYGKFVTFCMPKTMVDYKWDVGTYFADKQDFVDVIKTYAIENGRNIKYIKNDKKRIRLKCMGAKGECPWMAYCAYMEAIHTWQLRTIVDNHRCSREHKLRLLNAKWLSKRLEKTVKQNPQVKGVEIREKINRKWNVGVSRCMAYRTKDIASDNVDGSFKDQYRRIYDYANEVLAHNPGSTVKVKVEENVDEAIFRRFYTCLKACKDSFVSCRPIIGLDGAFLKGKYDGEMLTAVGRDANDQMLPLAYVVVEVEKKDTWRWFLELLVEDLSGEEVSSSFTFMSDQQKGLLQAVQEVVPRVDQRFCAATTTHPQAWEAEMRNIKQLNDEVFKYLLKIPPRYWSRSRFSSKPKCYTLVNNMSEAFNSVMVHTSWSANKIFEVRHVSQAGDKFVVNLDENLCTCRKWEITGIPCCHTLAAMKFLNLDAEEFIPCCFRKSTYEETYSSIVYPINGNNLWEITTYDDVFPPPKRTLPGKPKKKRRLEQWALVKDDKRMRKGGLKKRCGICKELDHNRTSCTKAKQTIDLNSQQTQQSNPSTQPMMPSSNQVEAAVEGDK
ncbi:uncharacterized protein LOC128195279 [Vigna angularis]|uniref:uncharacterized protein LOC128195279 n=1 Tax=Phaseolus angularis TaxID=3914 RepID=UPI0022B44AC4|nr:uncharacterized protein LOC128195279 [Vigna angularis]